MPTEKIQTAFLIISENCANSFNDHRTTRSREGSKCNQSLQFSVNNTSQKSSCNSLDTTIGQVTAGEKHSQDHTHTLSFSLPLSLSVTLTHSFSLYILTHSLSFFSLSLSLSLTLSLYISSLSLSLSLSPSYSLTHTQEAG